MNLYLSVNSDMCRHGFGDCSVAGKNSLEEPCTPLVGQGSLYSSNLNSTNKNRIKELKEMIENEKERLTMGGGPTSEMYIEQWEHEIETLSHGSGKQ